MKKLQATNDKTKYALVDDDIAEIIQEMGLKFCVQPNGYFRSTSNSIKLPGMKKNKYLLLHRFVYIIKVGVEPNSEIDHIDFNPANNQFENLRLATRQEQQQHRGKLMTNTSCYIGVSVKHNVNKRYKNGYRDYWLARIQRPDGHREAKHFPYTDEGLIAAARWRDTKAIDYFGKFHGQLNFPDDNK